MSSPSNLLEEFHLIGSNQFELGYHLQDESSWNILINNSFDPTLISEEINLKVDSQRSKLLKFGIDCLLTFIQANFTGPTIDKGIDDFLSNKISTNFDFKKVLGANEENVNVNTKFVCLLAAAKAIFKSCLVDKRVNLWWQWRSLFIHQQIVDDLCPTILKEVDEIYKELQKLELDDAAQGDLDLEVAHMYLTYRYVSKSKKHLESACDKHKIQYKLIGKLGKRTKFQEKALAQLSLEVTTSGEVQPEVQREDQNIPKNLALNDETRLNAINFTEETSEEEVTRGLSNSEQKVLIAVVKEMLIARPKADLQAEEVQPFIDFILKQTNTYTVRVVALLLRSKLEQSNRKTIERSLAQCEEIIASHKRDQPAANQRVLDVFATGLPTIWQTQGQYADLLLNIGLVKNSLDIYLEIKSWEEVIACYTILQLRHKATEIIEEQLKQGETAKLWCLLGDSTDNPQCYETAWKLSNQKSYRAQRHWGNYFYSRKEFAQSIAHYETSLHINPLQSNIWFRLGFAALQTENWQTCANAFRRYTTLEPESFEAWNNLAQAYIKLGHKRNAHQAILEALKVNFDNWKVWENLLVTSCDVGQVSDMIRSYHRLLDLKEKYVNVAVLKMLVQYVSGDESGGYLKSSRELFGRITSIHTNEGNVWELYAELAPSKLLRVQRLQKAYKGLNSAGGWKKSAEDFRELVGVCVKLTETFFEGVDALEINKDDPIFSSVRLTVKSVAALVSQSQFGQDEEYTSKMKELVDKIEAFKCK